MTYVLLGNPAPLVQIKRPVEDADGNLTVEQIGVPAPHLTQSVTRAEMWEGFDDPVAVEHSLSTDNDQILNMVAMMLGEEHRHYAIGVNEVRDLWVAHCDGGRKPSWVDSDDPAFALAISAFFGCPVGEPTALLTDGGRDKLHDQHLTTGAQPAAFNYMALTANTGPASAAHTTLSGEIATASGGLIRAQATYAHTAGTNTSTLTKTFTANGSDTLPVTVAMVGVFNASSSGTMGYEKVLASTATLSSSGDNIAVTYTLTIG